MTTMNNEDPADPSVHEQRELPEPAAWRVYFPDEQREELASSLDELCDDLTNCAHDEPEPLYTADQMREAIAAERERSHRSGARTKPRTTASRRPHPRRAGSGVGCTERSAGRERATEMTAERFHLGAVLSMTTGKMLCQMDDIYRIAQHLAGEPVWTHQLGRVMTESRPHLLAQFPALASVTGEDVTPDNFAAWLYERVTEHGEFLDVAPMPADAHESIDPISELAEKVHPDRIVTVSA